jgi:hypothetical protein
MTNTSGEKELKTNYPVTEGLIAGTTKQTGREMGLVPEVSLVSSREKEGLI